MELSAETVDTESSMMHLSVCVDRHTLPGAASWDGMCDTGMDHSRNFVLLGLVHSTSSLRDLDGD